MKKSIKSIMMLVLAFVMCFSFTDKAMADVVHYDAYICGEEITSENMSGEGWRFEPATEEDGYNKLYLNNANLIVDENTFNTQIEGQGIQMMNNLEIVLTGDNTINSSIDNVRSEYRDSNYKIINTDNRHRIYICKNREVVLMHLYYDNCICLDRKYNYILEHYKVIAVSKSGKIGED